MNNHILRSMTLEQAKLNSSDAMSCWSEITLALISPDILIDLVHHQIECLTDMPFEEGTWIIVRHHTGVEFPAILPDGQREQSAWEGISMSACLLVVKTLSKTYAEFSGLLNELNEAINTEALEELPSLVA